MYRPVIITIRSGIGEAGKTTAYVRQGSEDLDEDPNEYIAVSTRCAHLGCPVRFVRAAGIFSCPCHGGAYDFEGKVIGGPPVRPSTVSRRASSTARSRSARATASPAISSPSARAIPASSPGGSGSISIRPVRRRRRRPSMPKLDSLIPHPFASPRKPGQNGNRNGANGDGEEKSVVGEKLKEAPVDLVGWVDERTGATPFLTGMLLRKVPRAPTGSTPWARQPCSPSSSRR